MGTRVMPSCTQLRLGDQELRDDGVAELLASVRRRLQIAQVEHRRQADPQMRQFVRRVNICAARPSAAFRKISGAYWSVSTKPRNSSGSSLRWLLLPTTPLLTTTMPTASARARKARRASVQVP